jgi:hypothetical protein
MPKTGHYSQRSYKKKARECGLRGANYLAPRLGKDGKTINPGKCFRFANRKRLRRHLRSGNTIHRSINGALYYRKAGGDGKMMKVYITKWAKKRGFRKQGADGKWKQSTSAKYNTTSGPSITPQQLKDLGSLKVTLLKGPNGALSVKKK